MQFEFIILYLTFNEFVMKGQNFVKFPPEMAENDFNG